jgi:hypothetical protein
MSIYPFEPDNKNKYWELHKNIGLPYPKYAESWRGFGKFLDDKMYKPWNSGGRVVENYKDSDLYFVDGFLRHTSERIDTNFELNLDEKINDFYFSEKLLKDYPFATLALAGIKNSYELTQKDNTEDRLIIYLDDLGDYANSTFIHINVGKNSKLKVKWSISAEKGNFSLPLINYHLDEGAEVENVYFFQCDKTSSMFPLIFGNLQDNSYCFNHTTILSEGVFRKELFVYIDSENANYIENGVSLFSDGVGEVVNTIEHPKPNSRSIQNIRTLSSNGALGSWQGMAKVYENCEGTDAEQHHKGLVLSETSRIHMKPQLEILTDDVSCAHGASLGKLDENVLSYMMSRGIPKDVAKGLLIEAFVKSSFDEEIDIDNSLYHILNKNTDILIGQIGA